MPDSASPALHVDPPSHNGVTNGIKIEEDIFQDNTRSISTLSDGVNKLQNGEQEEHPDAPQAKRRKLTNGFVGHKSSPRASSPPWRSSQVEGPTSFVEDGKRRSARTNLVPLELQPQSRRRQTRAAFGKGSDKQSRPSYNLSRRPKIENVQPRSSARTGHLHRKESAKPVKKPHVASIIEKKKELESTLAKLQGFPKKRRGRPPRKPLPVKSEDVPTTDSSSELSDESLDSLEDLSLLPSPPVTLKKVMFRVHIPKPKISTPANVPLQRKYGSFEEFLDKDRSEEGWQEPLTFAQIKKEAANRIRVRSATRPGKLSNGDLFKRLPERQTEPRREYAHQDHLLAHVGHFRTLLRQERRDHKRKAETLAHEAKKYLEEKAKKGRVKTAEEIEKEKFEISKNIYRTVVRDMGRLWQAVSAEVNNIRQREYEEEQQARLKGHLNRVLDRTDQMLKRNDTSVSTSDIDETDLDEETDGDDSTDSEEMSETDSDSEVSVEPHDPDADMTIEQLRAKYGDVTELKADSEVPEEEVSDTQMDSAAEDSDPETEMDSEFDSMESEEEDDDDDEEGSEEERVGGLASLFSKNELAEMAPNENDIISPVGEQEETDLLDTTGTLDAPVVGEISDSMALDDENHAKEPDTVAVNQSNANTVLDDKTSRDLSLQTSPHTSASKASELESVSSIEPRGESQHPKSPDDKSSTIKTPIPPLLRGTLREYQHEGLDWLANLYAGGRSGILADEMGLGKTIQSIALLAHLATTYEVWGPHLIVVPTSVMLNWEMEFKKFLPGFKVLTYYGSLEERKQKRRGWMADDSFNVCITSYQLVLQDANSFKRRRWHYMILDEAHNIKNFRSERWQTMMTFNTRARLLLTGTPLQNNLTELWSLLFFLHYGQENEGEDDAFAGLKEWSEWFKRPVESILEHGKQVLDQEDQEQVSKLHKVIRPFLLRRLKADVEKQMPLKYEHVEMCRLSKRQRQLYDGFMSRAQTKETLASGNYLSIINALMQLRKVCNHPDLFETRPITTSFAMSKSVVAQCEIDDLLLRRKLCARSSLDDVDLDFLQLVPISNESMSMIQLIETSKRHAYRPMKELRDRQWQRVRQRSKIFASTNRGEVMQSLESVARRARLQDIDRTMYYQAYRHHQHPIYGQGLLKKVDVKTKYNQLSRIANGKKMERFWDQKSAIQPLDLVHSIVSRSKMMEPFVEQYACVTPAVVANDFSQTLITEAGASALREVQSRWITDPFHQARMKLSIAFPDKRLLQYDCGKLQRLDKLLRQLQSGGHRALIFTQMTKVLDILEQFLNIHGHRYLRLDGATKIEQRQILTDRFNNDNRILCFILSSRSGGLGINLTGADTVIFYDLDWNPAMDKQCTDRAHRIGQTRDVHIYRFVSEHTIESNILRKASQKQLLDDVVIQEGDFTTDYLNKISYKDMLDEEEETDMAGAAMDRVLGNGKGATTAFEQVEDREDIAAARVAAKEVQHADDGDFEDKIPQTGTGTPQVGEPDTSGPFGATDVAIAEANGDGIHHIDDYMLRLQKLLLKDSPLPFLRDRSKRGRKKAKEKEYKRSKRR